MPRITMLFWPGHVADDVDGGQGADEVVEVRQRLLLDELRGERGDALGHVLQVFARRVAVTVTGSSRVATGAAVSWASPWEAG